MSATKNQLEDVRKELKDDPALAGRLLELAEMSDGLTVALTAEMVLSPAACGAAFGLDGATPFGYVRRVQTLLRECGVDPDQISPPTRPGSPRVPSPGRGLGGGGI